MDLSYDLINSAKIFAVPSKHIVGQHFLALLIYINGHMPCFNQWNASENDVTLGKKL